MEASVLVLCIAVALGTAAGAAELPKDVTAADACAVVPGDEVARALGSTLVEAKLVRPDGAHARCVYTVSAAGAKTGGAAFVLWLHGPGDFDDLRANQGDPVSPVEGLGDAAFISLHPGSGRHDLFVLLRGVATIEATGPDATGVMAVTAVAIRRLRPKG